MCFSRGFKKVFSKIVRRTYPNPWLGVVRSGRPWATLWCQLSHPSWPAGQPNQTHCNLLPDPANAPPSPVLDPCFVTNHHFPDQPVDHRDWGLFQRGSGCLSRSTRVWETSKWSCFVSNAPRYKLVGVGSTGWFHHLVKKFDPKYFVPSISNNFAIFH